MCVGGVWSLACFFDLVALWARRRRLLWFCEGASAPRAPPRRHRLPLALPLVEGVVGLNACDSAAGNSLFDHCGRACAYFSFVFSFFLSVTARFSPGRCARVLFICFGVPLLFCCSVDTEETPRGFHIALLIAGGHRKLLPLRSRETTAIISFRETASIISPSPKHLWMRSRPMALYVRR